MVMLKNSYQRCILMQQHSELKICKFIIIMALFLIIMVILSIKTQHFQLYDATKMTQSIFNPLCASYTSSYRIKPLQMIKYYVDRIHTNCSYTYHYYSDKYSFKLVNINAQSQKEYYTSVF
eukprot:533530_1